MRSQLVYYEASLAAARLIPVSKDLDIIAKYKRTKSTGIAAEIADILDRLGDLRIDLLVDVAQDRKSVPF